MDHLGFEELEVYKQIRELCKGTYMLIKKFPSEEKFALCDQLRRSIVSVGSNIAEGYGRFSIKEKINFLAIANGSLYEAYFQLQLAQDFGYITLEEFKEKRDEIYRISRMITGLKKFYENNLNSQDSSKVSPNT